MEKKYSILLVEDEVKLSNVIKSELQRLGYVVDAAFNGQEAESLFFSKTYNLVILDISLPDKSGFELCKSFREHSKNAPIIMLTALSEIQDKIDAFKLGADDYMVKPFHFDELFARINVFLKRAEQENKDFANDVIEILDLVINLKTKTVFRNNIEIPLTAKEFALITLLAKNRGVVVSKQEILEKVWDLSFDTGTNTIEVYISFIRNKIDKPFAEKLIYTKSGFGYFIK